MSVPLQRKYVRLDGSVEDPLTRTFTHGLEDSTASESDGEGDEESQHGTDVKSSSASTLSPEDIAVTDEINGDATSRGGPSPPLTFEEKVWLEVIKLKREMWLARGGIKEAEEVREEAEKERQRRKRQQQPAVGEVTTGLAR